MMDECCLIYFMAVEGCVIQFKWWLRAVQCSSRWMRAVQCSSHDGWGLFNAVHDGRGLFHAVHDGWGLFNAVYDGWGLLMNGNTVIEDRTKKIGQLHLPAYCTFLLIRSSSLFHVSMHFLAICIFLLFSFILLIVIFDLFVPVISLCLLLVVACDRKAYVFVG